MEGKIKILQINSVANTGSTGKIAEHIGRMAMDMGWASYIAYGRAARPSQSQLIKIGNIYSIVVHFLISKLFDKHGWGSKHVTQRFIKKLERINPDIVHIHNLHGYYINFPILLRYLSERNIPTLVTLHDFWLLTGHCAYIESGCNKWKAGCYNCPRTKQYPAAVMDGSPENWKNKKEILNNFPKLVLVPVSRWLATYVKKSFLQNHPMCVIHNGIDTNVFQPHLSHNQALLHIDWSKFTILCIATRWTETNGLEDIIALSRILPSHAQIIMIGVSDKQKTLLPSSIIGINKTEDIHMLTELYTRSDVLFNISKEVTFGLVTAESLACGTPVIVWRNTAGEEIIDDKTGYIIDTIEDIPALIVTIRKNKSVELPRLCQNRIQEYFNAEKQYQRYFELYKSQIACKPR